MKLILDDTIKSTVEHFNFAVRAEVCEEEIRDVVLDEVVGEMMGSFVRSLVTNFADELHIERIQQERNAYAGKTQFSSYLPPYKCHFT